MTELEKSRNDLHADIDLNELVKELRVAIKSCMNDMAKKIAKGDFATFDRDVSTAEALEPAFLALHVFNTVMTRIGMTSETVPFLLGAIGALEKSLTEHLDPPEKMMAHAVKEVLSDRITAVTIRVPRRKEE